jgi:hypothetical protein
MPDFGDIEKMADDHDKQVDEGIGKAGDEAGQKLGHENEIDKGVNLAQEHTGGGDTQQ